MILDCLNVEYPIGPTFGLGINVGSTALVPSRTLQWLDAPDSDGIIADRRGVFSRPVYTDNNCKKFDGTGDYAEVDSSAALGNFGTADFEIHVCCDFTTPAANRAIVSKYRTATNERSWLLQNQPTGLVFAASTDGTAATLKTVILPPSLVPQRVACAVLKRTGTVVKISFDGGAQMEMTGSGSVVNIFSSAVPINIGRAHVGAYYNSYIAYIAIPGLFDYSLADGPNLKLYDRSGLGHDATFTSTSGIDTMAVTRDDAPPINIINGFTLYTHATLDPLRVSYDINGDPLSITPPTGYTLVSEHPGGYLHNGAESTITQTDDRLDEDVFWSDGEGALVARTKLEILSNNQDADATRSAFDDSDNIVEILVFPAALTGARLSVLNAYLDSKHSPLAYDSILGDGFLNMDLTDNMNDVIE